MKGYARLTYRSRARRMTPETDSSCASAFSSAAAHRSSGMRTLRSGVDAMSSLISVGADVTLNLANRWIVVLVELNGPGFAASSRVRESVDERLPIDGLVVVEPVIKGFDGGFQHIISDVCGRTQNARFHGHDSDHLSVVRVNQRAAARAAVVQLAREVFGGHGRDAAAVGDAIFNHGHVNHRVPASSGGAHGSSSVGVPVGTQYRHRVPTQAPSRCLYTTVTQGVAA